jgi:transposase
MVCIGEDRTERLEYEPGKLYVRVIIRPKFACPEESHTVVQAPAPPSPNPGGKFGFGVAAQVIVNKFADHLPLYRQQDILARHGVTFSRSTLCGIVKGVAELLAPLAALMRKRLLATDLVGADDTPVRLLTPGEPPGSRQARFWLFHGFEEAPYNVFWFHESRSRDGPATFLAEFSGYVKADGYGTEEGVYLGSGGRMIASGCWMHVRRYFEQAKESSPRLAHMALGWIRQLYDIEDRARTFTPEDRLALRQQESAPIVDKFHEWLLEQKPQLRPKSAIAKAVNYSLNQWTALITFLEDGRLPIDNGDSERYLRTLTVGRDNWKFLGRATAGPRAGNLYTVLSTAHRHLLDEVAYLHAVMPPLAEGISESELEAFLPDVWSQDHPESVRQFRIAERLQIAAAKAHRREERRQAEGRLILPS